MCTWCIRILERGACGKIYGAFKVVEDGGGALRMANS